MICYDECSIFTEEVMRKHIKLSVNYNILNIDADDWIYNIVPLQYRKVAIELIQTAADRMIGQKIDMISESYFWVFVMNVRYNFGFHGKLRPSIIDGNDILKELVQ